jgi:predicted Zn-dependent protease
VYGNLATEYMALNRLDEARATLDQALARKLDVFVVRMSMYDLAFLQNNPAAMKEQVAWARGKPGSEDFLLFLQSNTEAYYGRLQKAREFTQQAVNSAMHNDLKEVAASYKVYAAVREAEFGDMAQARQEAAAALALSPEGQELRLWAALALAQIGDTPQSQKLVDRLNNDFPNDTLIQQYWLPSVRATLEVAHGNASKATELLQAASSYDLGAGGVLISAFVRGQASLLARNGTAAALEFQKLLDHPGMVQNWPFGVLAHLELGRAYAIVGDTAKAKSAYQDFLALWKEADPNIPILKQAKAEYEKLK